MAVTADTLALMKASLAKSSDDIAKTINTATGLVAYDLQAPAKNLYPVNTPIRNRLPRVSGGVGVATNWKSITKITGSGYDAMGWVPEGQRTGRMSYTTETKSASYATLGEEDMVTFEAINAGRTFEDIRSTASMRVLQKMMLKEENALLFGNKSVALGTTPTPVNSAVANGATLPAATYSVICVALTAEGYRGASVSATGVPTTQNVTGADGQTYTLKGGSAQKSAAASQVIALGEELRSAVNPVRGAVGYAWFVGVAGSEKIEAITTVNSVVISKPLLATGQAATAVTADNSSNWLGFDGLVYAALATGSGAYVKDLATGTPGTGTGLTASGMGTIVEIDEMLRSMWDNWQTSATVIYVNSQELMNITRKVLTGPSASPLLQIMTNPESGTVNMLAGGIVGFYFNPFTADGGRKIPIKIHPTLPPGIILGWAEDLPMQYQSNNVPNVAEVKVRQDYYQLDWPLRTRAQEFGVYSEEVLAVYAPFAMGVIKNIANS